MSRTLTAAVSTEVALDRIRLALLAHMAFDSGDVRVWSGIGDLVWDSNTYSGIGTLGKVSLIEETINVRAAGIRFELSGIEAALLSTALTEHYQGRACSVWLAMFDANDALILDPVPVFTGLMDQMEIEDSGDVGRITLSAESRLVALERPPEISYYTDQDQQALYPNDFGFEFVPAMQEAIILWGRNRVDVAKASSAAGGASAIGPNQQFISVPSGEDAPGVVIADPALGE